ncbi:MAG: hypothetical protein ACJZ7Z_02555 [Myxococcota bacterium]
MMWGSVAAVPTLGWLGLVLLLALLVVTVFWKMKRVSLQAGVTLSVLLLVPFLMAPHITTWEGLTWYTFINGEPANADQVNQNFSALADALDVTVPNSFANSGIADAGEVNANFEALRAAVDSFTNDLAAATQATQTAGSNACTQAGGTWNGETSTCTAALNYNCFVGGFCSQAAIEFPPATYGYTNVYEGDTQGAGSALAAACNSSPGSALWVDGIQFWTVYRTDCLTSFKPFHSSPCSMCL